MRVKLMPATAMPGGSAGTRSHTPLASLGSSTRRTLACGRSELLASEKAFPRPRALETTMSWMGTLPRAESSIKLDFSAAYDLSRDGGTGRRSGLKIRRCLALWGFNSPSRHQSNPHVKNQLGYQEAEIYFMADNPGPTLFHCHQQLHMDFGFMTLFDYV